MRAISKVIGAAMLMVLGTAFQAQALTITAGVTTSVLTGNQTSQAQIDAAIAATLGTSIELYKDNAGGAEEKSLASSYATVYNGDLSGGTITYTGGQFVGPTAFLLVKDGNQQPAWYLYNLTNLLWNGTEVLTLTGFWPQQGAISHVALYGITSTTQVPDGGMTISLLGSALVGLGLLRRRFAA